MKTPEKKYVMALDQGTTSSRCILFDHNGQIVSVSQRDFEQIYPQPGWVEHDPMTIWSTQIGVAAEACAKIGADSTSIAAIGITNQRETTIVWDKKTGKPIANAIVWQCRRTSPIIDDMDNNIRTKILQRTGLIPDAYFSATKIKWLLDNTEGARKAAEAGELLFGTVDTWLLWNLTGGKVHATDYTNASRTMLYDIHKLTWDKELLDYFGIPESMMPEVHPSGYHFGESEPEYFGGSIPVCSLCGDQQSSLFGLCCFEKGDVKNTYGTGCFLLMNTGDEAINSRNGLITTIAGGLKEKPDYALEGSIYMGGAVIQWLRDEMKLITTAAESEELAGKVEDTAGAYLVPSFTGLGAPYWQQDARGTMVGITRGFNRFHMVRAALEAISYQTMDVIRAMEADSGVTMTSLKADGGASVNNFLMQFQSDIVGAEIICYRMAESTALGAAYLAGLCTGFWKDQKELADDAEVRKIYKPQMAEKDRQEKTEQWHRAVDTACCWAENN